MSEDLKGLNNTDPNLSAEQVGYWQSYEELYNDSEFLQAHQDEFKEGVSESLDTSEMSSISRRKFLALLGASAALAGTACSDYRDKGEIIPYNKKREEITLGKANYYASTCTACPNACGTLFKTRDELVQEAGDEALKGDAAYQKAKAESDRHVCNWYCHYQGSARVYCMVGYSLAEAMKPLLTAKP